MEGSGTPPLPALATQMRFAAATGQAAARGALRLARQQSAESVAATTGGSDDAPDPSRPGGTPAADCEAQGGGQREPSGSRHEPKKAPQLEGMDAGGAAGSGESSRVSTSSNTPPPAAPAAAQPPAAPPAAQPSASSGARDAPAPHTHSRQLTDTAPHLQRSTLAVLARPRGHATVHERSMRVGC